MLTPTGAAEPSLKSVQEGGKEAADEEMQETVVVDDGQVDAGKKLPPAVQRSASHQPSRKSMDCKRQESLLIGSVSMTLRAFLSCLLVTVQPARGGLRSAAAAWDMSIVVAAPDLAVTCLLHLIHCAFRGGADQRGGLQQRRLEQSRTFWPNLKCLS